MQHRTKGKNIERRARSRRAKRISNKLKKTKQNKTRETSKTRQTTLRNKNQNETKMHREETSKRIMGWLRHILDKEQPKRFKKEINKQRNTHSFCCSKMLVCQAC